MLADCGPVSHLFARDAGGRGRERAFSSYASRCTRRVHRCPTPTARAHEQNLCERKLVTRTGASTCSSARPKARRLTSIVTSIGGRRPPACSSASSSSSSPSCRRIDGLAYKASAMAAGGIAPLSSNRTRVSRPTRVHETISCMHARMFARFRCVQVVCRAWIRGAETRAAGAPEQDSGAWGHCSR